MTDVGMRYIRKSERWVLSAWSCRRIGCDAQTSVSFDQSADRWVVQHGPNPEHVLLISPYSFGIVSLIEDAPPVPAGQVDIDAWLERVHAA
jgi:hypothetical protein